MKNEKGPLTGMDCERPLMDYTGGMQAGILFEPENAGNLSRMILEQRAGMKKHLEPEVQEFTEQPPRKLSGGCSASFFWKGRSAS